MTQSSDNLILTAEELAFFHYTCDVFPTPESPLRFLEGGGDATVDGERLYRSLGQRGLLNEVGSGAAQLVLDRVTPVSECNARVRMTTLASSTVSRDFFLNDSGAVEFHRHGEQLVFGPLRSETALAAELAQVFQATPTVQPRQLRMTSGEYLVFAVFARDVRAVVEPAPEGPPPMSLHEVLAYFDEPEEASQATASDENWQQSVRSLADREVLVPHGDGYQLHRDWHGLARQIVADRRHTITRFDFVDEYWLVREVSIYPTTESVFRFGTDADGTVCVEELSRAALADVLGSVVGTLPNLLNPDAPLTVRPAAPGTLPPVS